METIAKQLLEAVKKKDGRSLLHADKAFHDHLSVCIKND